MATIISRPRRDGKPRYTVTVRKAGHRSRSKTFSRKTDAKAWAIQVEGQIERGEAVPTRKEQRRTVGELIDRFIEEDLVRKSARDTVAARNLLLWWKGQIGRYRLSEVTPDKIRRARRRLARGGSPSGRPVAAATQNRYLAHLSRAFSVAVREWGWLDDNPVRRIARVKEPRGRVRFLSEEERTRLLEVCAGRSSRLHFLVVMALTTGGRSAELMGLRWRDVDFERRRVVFHDTKNGERRSAPLVGDALTLARERSRIRRIDTDLVFVGPGGRAVFPRKQWNAAVEEAELEDFRFHDLRHTFASWCLMSGASLGELAKLMGHKTLQMVQRYSHLTDEHEALVVERMVSRYLSSSS